MEMPGIPPKGNESTHHIHSLPAKTRESVTRVQSSHVGLHAMRVAFQTSQETLGDTIGSHGKVARTFSNGCALHDEDIVDCVNN